MAEEKQPFFQFLNSVDGGQSAELFVYDDIWPYESYWWDMPNPQGFMAQLAALGDVKNITVRINSNGGDLFAAQAIYTQLRRHSASITTYVDGMAASAASLIAMAGDKRIMPAGSMMVIHNPIAGAYGDYRVLESATDAAKASREALMSVYLDRTSLSREEIGAMLDHETWLTAHDALSMGFATEVDNFVQIAANISGDKLVVNGRSFAFDSFKTIPAAMLARREEVTNDMSTTNVTNEAEEAAAAATSEEAAAADAGTELEDDLAADVEETAADAGETGDQDAITNAITAERTRIREIMDLARPGAEQIISNAIANGTQPGDVAMEILKCPGVKNNSLLNAMRADAPKVAATAGSLGSGQMNAKEGRVSRLAAAIFKNKGLDPK